MRFFPDHDVDARIRGILIRRGHICTTASQANLWDATDDTLTVYAVLVTHEKEFSQRRRRNVVGMHIQLRCAEPDALDLLEKHLDEVVDYLRSSRDIFISVSFNGLTVSHRWA